MTGDRQTLYATARDGSQIAYQVIGAGPFDLVYLTGALSHVDVRWEHPSIERFLERLGSFSRLITFDRRGVGASDQLPDGIVPTWEEWSEDLSVVLDATNSTSAALFGVVDGGTMSIAFAAAHPERVRALVLFSVFGRTIRVDDSDGIEFVAQAYEQGWGTEDWVKVVAPSVADDPGQRAWFAKYMRATATPHATAAQFRVTARTTIDAVLPLVQAPTLVMTRTDRDPPPPEMVRELAAQLPNSRVVEVPGTDVSPVPQHSDEILDIIEEFLTGTRPPRSVDRFLATVLFTDIVDSTPTAIALGDRAWRDRLDAHDAMIRTELRRHRGNEIKTTGDGFLATFDGPGRAIQCACALQEGAQQLGIEIRAGLHTGEVEGRGDDITGVAVNIGARVAALAGPNEILVTRTVTELVAGSDIGFNPHGDHALKGIPGDWALFSVAT